MADTASTHVYVPERMQITAAEYHRYPAASSTQLKKILRSPAHYKQELEHPTPPTPAQSLGTLIHLAVLEPDNFRANTVVRPKFSGKGSRAQAIDWHREQEGKIVVESEQMNIINGVLHSLTSHK